MFEVINVRQTGNGLVLDVIDYSDFVVESVPYDKFMWYIGLGIQIKGYKDGVFTQHKFKVASKSRTLIFLIGYLMLDGNPATYVSVRNHKGVEVASLIWNTYLDVRQPLSNVGFTLSKRGVQRKDGKEEWYYDMRLSGCLVANGNNCVDTQRVYTLGELGDTYALAMTRNTYWHDPLRPCFSEEQFNFKSNAYLNGMLVPNQLRLPPATKDGVMYAKGIISDDVNTRVQHDTTASSEEQDFESTVVDCILDALILTCCIVLL